MTNRKIRDNHIARIALATALILLVPLVAMRFSEGVDWRLNDFIIAGFLIFCAGLVLELIISSVRTRKRRLVAVGVLALAFMYIWAELAVGIFTNWGS